MSKARSQLFAPTFVTLSNSLGDHTSRQCGSPHRKAPCFTPHMSSGTRPFPTAICRPLTSAYRNAWMKTFIAFPIALDACHRTHRFRLLS